MMNFFNIVISIFFAMGLSSLAIADTAVIVHPSNANALAKNDVKTIFLGKTLSFASGGNIIPINQKANTSTRIGFDDAVLAKSAGQIKSYWSKRVFTGKGTPPKEVDTDAEVKSLVSANPDTIGYIDSSEVDDSVKVLFTF